MFSALPRTVAVLSALPRLTVANDDGLAIDLATSGDMVLSRASSRVTSVGDRVETDSKTRPISVDGSAAAGGLVVSGPVIATPT